MTGRRGISGRVNFSILSRHHEAGLCLEKMRSAALSDSFSAALSGRLSYSMNSAAALPFKVSMFSGSILDQQSFICHFRVLRLLPTRYPLTF